MTERRWPQGLRVRPIGERFFVTPEDDEVYGSMTGTVVEPTYSLSRGGWLEWWVNDGQADRWVLAEGWEIEPIPPIWVRQSRPKPPPVNHVDNWDYSRNHRRVAVYSPKDESSWHVEKNGALVRKFDNWQEAIDYANELAYNRG